SRLNYRNSNRLHLRPRCVLTSAPRRDLKHLPILQPHRRQRPAPNAAGIEADGSRGDVEAERGPVAEEDGETFRPRVRPLEPGGETRRRGGRRAAVGGQAPLAVERAHAGEDGQGASAALAAREVA